MTTSPAKDLTDENLAKYDVLLLNYKDTAKGSPETQVVRRQQAGVPEGGQGRQGAGGVPPRLECLRQAQLGRVREGDRGRLAVAGLPRAQARLQREEDARQAPDLRGPARRSSSTKIDELYQKSVMVPGNTSSPRRIPTRARRKEPARTSRSSGSTPMARAGCTTTPWATTSRRCPTPISSPGCGAGDLGGNGKGGVGRGIGGTGRGEFHAKTQRRRKDAKKTGGQ